MLTVAEEVAVFCSSYSCCFLASSILSKGFIAVMNIKIGTTKNKPRKAQPPQPIINFKNKGMGCFVGSTRACTGTVFGWDVIGVVICSFILVS
jgi:hypothetical protein